MKEFKLNTPLQYPLLLNLLKLSKKAKKITFVHLLTLKPEKLIFSVRECNIIRRFYQLMEVRYTYKLSNLDCFNLVPELSSLKREAIKMILKN
jgi:hypothetical protein